MGERERILWADDDIEEPESTVRFFVSKVEEDGHTIVARVTSVEEVKELVESGVDFSLAIVDGDMPEEGDGEMAAGVIRENNPEITVMSFSGYRQKWGDINLTKADGKAKLLEAIRNV